MLKHIPTGLGHPYRTEPFERSPHYPTTESTITLRVCTDLLAEAVTARIQCGESTTDITMTFVGSAVASDEGPFGKTSKEMLNSSHLEDAAVRSGEYSEWKQWEIQVPKELVANDFSYSFISDSTSESYFVSLSKWTKSNQLKISTTGVAKEILDLEWLIDSLGNPHAVRFSLELNQEDHIVGFGERFHSVDQTNQFVDAVVYEEYKGQGHRTYLPVPFFNVIGSNYGVHLNTANPSRFSVGRVYPNLINIEIDLDPSDSFVEIDFYEGSPSQVLKQYLDRVGQPPIPPEWIYSLWISSNEWNTQSRVKREVRECIEAGIKPGVVVIEAWSDETTFTVFRDARYQVTDGKKGLSAGDITYPLDGAWPSPGEMIKELHEQDIKLILWQIPIIKEEGSDGSQSQVNWKYAVENDLVIKDEDNLPYRVRGFWFRDGLLPDLTDEKVQSWWAEQRRYLVTELGVDGFKTDGGEHAWGQKLRFLDGKVGLQKNNLFPVGYAQTFHDLLRNSGKDPITFSRAGFTGSQKFPTFWAGDENSTWGAYQASINAGITASASGFYFWGWDIGGFSGDIPSAELYLRGTAMAAFCPIMQIHSEFNHHKIPSNDRTPWNLARRHSDSTIIEVFRGFTKIRENLLSYIVGEGEIAVGTGRPLMSGLFFDFFDDPQIWKVPHQYMFGRHLLVAPITEPGVTVWKVYLPTGTWVNAWTAEAHEGRKWVEVQAPLSQIPVFIKAEEADELLNCFKL